MRERDLQTLVDQAARQEARPAPPPPEPPPAYMKPPMRFGVFLRMHGPGHPLTWLVPLALVLAGLLVTELRYAAYLGCVLLAIRIAVLGLGLVRGYAAFQRFPTDLAFPLAGWNTVFEERLLRHAYNWQDQVTVVVELAPGADRPVYEALLTLSLGDANRHFYGDKFKARSGDSRIRWTRDGLRVSGSLNVSVLGALYRLIRQLDGVHRRTGGIASVLITKHGDISTYEREDPDPA